jgi:hypothetical protein
MITVLIAQVVWSFCGQEVAIRSSISYAGRFHFSAHLNGPSLLPYSCSILVSEFVCTMHGNVSFLSYVHTENGRTNHG